MAVKLLAVDEVHATESADPALVVGHVDVPGAEVFRVHLLPFPPIVPQLRVVGGRCALDQFVPFDPKPRELQKVFPRVLVAKHPVVIPFLVPAAPIPFAPPPPQLVGVAVLGVAQRPAKHPGVQFIECLRCDHRAVVVRPAPDDGIELP